MHFLYLDESGGTERLDLGRMATPVMVILGVIVDARLVPLLTREFMALKRRYFSEPVRPRAGTRPRAHRGQGE